MKLINSKAEMLTQGKSFKDMLKHIELCGRTAYKSENKITENSAEAFVERIKKSNHGAVLEHGTVYLTVPIGTIEKDPLYSDKMNIVRFFANNKYSKVKSREENESIVFYYITTNYRVIFEHKDEKLFIDEWITEPTDEHERRLTFRFTCSRSISHELVRHRVFSFTQESQRYCNYSKDKFDNQITYIIPKRLDIKPQVVDGNNIESYKQQGDDVYEFISALKESESHYFSLLDERFGWTPENAREVLPNSTKTEICMTGFESDWEQLFRLRLFESTGRVHPDMKDLMDKAYIILCM